MVAPRVLSPWDSPGKNTGVGSHFLLQGIFPTQGSNPGPLHCRRILYHLSTQLLINTVPNSLLLSGNACLYITLALQLRTFPSCPTLWSWWVQILSQVRKSSLLNHDCMRSSACRPVFEEGVDSTRDDWGKEEAWKLLTSSGRLEHWFFFCLHKPISVLNHQFCLILYQAQIFLHSPFPRLFLFLSPLLIFLL